MVRRCHQKIRNEILFDRLHPLDALAAPVLGLEVIDGHALDIAKICHGDDRIFPGDHILHGNVKFVIADLASSVVAVFFTDDKQLFLDHAQKPLFIGKDRL